MAVAKGRPVIHSLDDPTGISGLRGRTLRAMRKRCDSAISELKNYARNVFEQNLIAIETNATTYVYEYSPQAQAITDGQIKNIIYRNLLGIGDPLWSVQWWMNSYLKASFDRGTNDSLRSAKNLSPPRS